MRNVVNIEINGETVGMTENQFLVCDIYGYPLRVVNAPTSYIGQIFKLIRYKNSLRFTQIS